MDSLVLRERLEIMVLREMLVSPALLDLPVFLDLRFAIARIHTSLKYENALIVPCWVGDTVVCPFRVPLETVAPRELAVPVDLP